MWKNKKVRRKITLGYFVFWIIMIVLGGCVLQKGNIMTSGRNRVRTVWVRNVLVKDCNRSNRRLGEMGIRYIKDSVFVIIVRNNIGMEGGRMYVYKDSVFAYNRKRKLLFSEDIKKINGNNENNFKIMDIERLLIQKGNKNSFFNLNVGMNRNRVSVVINGFKEVRKKLYVPDDIVVRYKNGYRNYCFRLLLNNISINKGLATKRYESHSYKRVKSFNEIM